jgi:hypothetical protein
MQVSVAAGRSGRFLQEIAQFATQQVANKRSLRLIVAEKESVIEVDDHGCSGAKDELIHLPGEKRKEFHINPDKIVLASTTELRQSVQVPPSDPMLGDGCRAGQTADIIVAEQWLHVHLDAGRRERGEVLK